MTKLDLRDGETRSQLGLWDGTVTLPSQHRHVTQNHRGRAETIELILHELNVQGAPMTRLQIARALGRAKTTWLSGILDSLVADSLLVKSHTIGANGMVVYWYEVTR